MPSMTPIESSMFSAIGYDAETLTLYVEFKPSKKQAAAGESGDMWKYRDVIPDRWAEMCAAESVGKWFLANVKGKYTGEKVEPGELYAQAVERASQQNAGSVAAYIEEHGGIDGAIAAAERESKAPDAGFHQRTMIGALLGVLISMRDGINGLDMNSASGITPAAEGEEF